MEVKGISLIETTLLLVRRFSPKNQLYLKLFGEREAQGLLAFLLLFPLGISDFHSPELLEKAQDSGR